MPPIEWLEVGLAASGLLILLCIGKAFQSIHAWGDGAEYEMLDLPTSEKGSLHALRSTTLGPKRSARHREKPGALGIADRVVRFGLCVALGYLSIAWFGMGSPAMKVAIVVVVYLFSTLCVGADPLYRLMRWSTLHSEKRCHDYST